MATPIKTKILLPRSSFNEWENSSRVLQPGELVLAYDGAGKFRLFEGNNAVFGENASGVKELILNAEQVVLSGDAEITLQAAIDDLRRNFSDALTSVAGTGTGVVTGISKNGQQVSAQFADLSGTASASGFNAITSITQDATGKIIQVSGISALTEHQSLENYYTSDDVDKIITGLSVEDSPASKQFVTSVSQTGGVVSVTKTQPALSDLVDADSIALKGMDGDALSSDQTVAGAKAYTDARIDEVTAGELTSYYKKTETSSAQEIENMFGSYLSGVSGTGTGVVTGISKNGQQVSAQFVDLTVERTASAGHALAGIAQGANGQITSIAQISVLDAASVKIGYSTDDKRIYLSAGENVTSIDASDFIKDGMLSTAKYDSESRSIILTFNTDAGAEPISVDVGDLVDTYTAADTSTIGMTLSSNQFSASINEGSITPNFLSASAEWIFDCNL